MVQCDIEHAFAVFTEKTAMRGGQGATGRRASLQSDVTFEPKVGGRIFEQTPGNAQFDWGQILGRDPPKRPGFLWHLCADRLPTYRGPDSLGPAADGTTRLGIEHWGGSAWATTGQPSATPTNEGWSGLLPHYVAACTPPSDSNRLIVDSDRRSKWNSLVLPHHRAEPTVQGDFDRQHRSPGGRPAKAFSTRRPGFDDAQLAWLKAAGHGSLAGVGFIDRPGRRKAGVGATLTVHVKVGRSFPLIGRRLLRAEPADGSRLEACRWASS